MNLEPNDYRNAVALINRADIKGQESEYVATLKKRLSDHADYLDKMDEAGNQVDERE